LLILPVGVHWERAHPADGQRIEVALHPIGGEGDELGVGTLAELGARFATLCVSL
jgi:hypothetical protein